MAPKVSAVRDDFVDDTNLPAAKAGSKTNKSRILRLLAACAHAIGSLALRKPGNVALQQLACAQIIML
jgi:hypothetical protein